MSAKRPGDIFRKAGSGSYKIESGPAQWAKDQRQRLYKETEGQRGHQEGALGELARQAGTTGPTVAGRQADEALGRGQTRIAQQLGTAGGGPQAARAALFATRDAGTRVAAPAMDAAAAEGLGAQQAYASGTGQVLGGRTALEQIALGYGQMGQLDKYRAQQLAHLENERRFRRQLNALGLQQQQYQDTMDTVMGALGSASSVAQMYGMYQGSPQGKSYWGTPQGQPAGAYYDKVKGFF